MFKTAIASFAVHLDPLVLYLMSVALVALWLKNPRNLFTSLETCLLFLMGRNPWIVKDLRSCKTLYFSRDTFTDVMESLQIHLFLQNKPNFRKRQMNVTALLTRKYDKMDTWSIGKNEPKTNPNEPKTNPILANKTTIQTQFKSKQSQFQGGA
jgi:hypothetical protein